MIIYVRETVAFIIVNADKTRKYFLWRRKK